MSLLIERARVCLRTDLRDVLIEAVYAVLTHASDAIVFDFVNGDAVPVLRKYIEEASALGVKDEFRMYGMESFAILIRFLAGKASVVQHGREMARMVLATLVPRTSHAYISAACAEIMSCLADVDELKQQLLTGDAVKMLTAGLPSAVGADARCMEPSDQPRLSPHITKALQLLKKRRRSLTDDAGDQDSVSSR